LEIKLGIHTRLGKDGKTLSKGQGQRIMIARAFYKNAPYLFMDEPTSALDNITAMNIIKNIKEMYSNKTAVIVTHKLTVAEKMDFIFLMDNGLIVESGTHTDLLNKGGMYTKLYNS